MDTFLVSPAFLSCKKCISYWSLNDIVTLLSDTRSNNLSWVAFVNTRTSLFLIQTILNDNINIITEELGQSSGRKTKDKDKEMRISNNL